ncbi:aldo/keto reductase [Dyadobacter subterraneus]|uniref:Aldo/keto reductase n=1 Tax=Dyadobacter subterraneus TaxID=2773304 RepID=A0ABR9WF83_9BACT|nr:aldo/keto reductase [Dyadobacter subterraneus]MBE9464160.1 aldo/keto reductase [Dyadobacter subterraneus]
MKNEISRREAMMQIGCIGAAALLNYENIMAENQQTMLQRNIPGTKEKLPVVGLGSWIQFDVGDSPSEKEGLTEVLTSMNKLGGKVIDSSPMYGRAEQVIGDLTAGLDFKDNFFYATKVWTTGKQAGIDQMNESFLKMRRKTMDLMQVHNLQDWQMHLKTIKGWKEEGKVRYAGITHYSVSAHQQLEQIVRSKVVDFVQFNYSIKVRNAEKSLLKTAQDNGVAVIINEPFDSGSLFKMVKGKALPPWAGDYDIKSWAQFFLKYILANPAVNCVIPGTSDKKHLVDNMGAGFGKLPDEAGLKMMLKYIETV